MPEEIKVYLEKKYSELKRTAKTYGDLEKIIRRNYSVENYADPEWGTFLYTQLNALLHKEWGSLSIQ